MVIDTRLLSLSRIEIYEGGFFAPSSWTGEFISKNEYTVGSMVDIIAPMSCFDVKGSAVITSKEKSQSGYGHLYRYRDCGELKEFKD